MILSSLLKAFFTYSSYPFFIHCQAHTPVSFLVVVAGQFHSYKPSITFFSERFVPESPKCRTLEETPQFPSLWEVSYLPLPSQQLPGPPLRCQQRHHSFFILSNTTTTIYHFTNYTSIFFRKHHSPKSSNNSSFVPSQSSSISSYLRSSSLHTARFAEGGMDWLEDSKYLQGEDLLIDVRFCELLFLFCFSCTFFF